jgi:hydrogenase maturation protease
MDASHPHAQTAPARAGALLVLGLGNRLMTDDAAGPLATDRVAARPGVAVTDGGTCGLALLPEIEDAAAVIVVDAARLGRAPGTVTTLEGAAMDAALRGVKSTAHEVALADLMDAARVTGRLPDRRALVAVEPARVALGVEPTPSVAAALDPAAAAVEALIARWSA